MAQQDIKQIRGATQGSILFLGTNSVVSEDYDKLNWDQSNSSFNINGTIYSTAITEPVSPASGSYLFVRDRANRQMWSGLGPSGVGYAFQPSIYANKIAWWNPPGNATTAPGVLGMAALSATGTATSRNVSTTNFFTRVRRVAVVSAATAGALCGYRNTVLQYTVGNGSGLGGFFSVIRFGTSDAATVAGARMFVGFRNTSSSPTNVEPSIITNCVGIGHGDADTNMKIYYGGSAAQTPINLGANFPANTLSVDMYELTLFASPNSNNTIGYRVERLNTGDIATGTLTGTAGIAIPNSTTFITFNSFRTNNATLLAVGMDFASIYIETDN